MIQDAAIACHECDLLHHVTGVPAGGTARCRRCGALLLQPKDGGLDLPLALAVAGLVLTALANTFPFLGFQLSGRLQQTVLASGILELYAQNMPGLASLVLFTTVLAPAANLLGLIYVLLPLKLGRRAPYMYVVFRLMRAFQPWSMLEIFMLGILISIVKLSKMAQIIPGTAVYCFMALIFVLAACSASLDPHAVWASWRVRR